MVLGAAIRVGILGVSSTPLHSPCSLSSAHVGLGVALGVSGDVDEGVITLSRGVGLGAGDGLSREAAGGVAALNRGVGLGVDDNKALLGWLSAEVAGGVVMLPRGVGLGVTVICLAASEVVFVA